MLEYTTGYFTGLRQIQGELLTLPPPAELHGVLVAPQVPADFRLVRQNPRYVHYLEVPGVSGETA